MFDKLIVYCCLVVFFQFTGDQAGKLQHKFNTNVTKQAKASLITKHTKESHEKVKSLVVQGKNLALA